MKLAKAIVSIVAVLTFLYYQYIIVTTGEKANELFLIGSGLSISAFAFLSIKWNDPIIITSLQLMCSTFFVAVIFIYIRRWVVEGNPSTNYYTALCFCVVFTFLYIIIYYLYHYAIGRRTIKH